MADPQTFDELKTAIASWGDRDDSDIDTIAAECIALAERRFQRDVFAPERAIEADLTIDSEEESLPSDLWEIKALHLATDPKTVLEAMTLADLRNTYSANATGRPQNYAVRGETIVFGPAPDAEYTGKLSYIQTIPALGDSQATNWLLSDHPDVYLHGALVELSTRMRDTDGITLHEARLQAAMASVNRSAVRRTIGGAPIRIRSPVVV